MSRAPLAPVRKPLAPPPPKEDTSVKDVAPTDADRSAAAAAVSAAINSKAKPVTETTGTVTSEEIKKRAKKTTSATEAESSGVIDQLILEVRVLRDNIAETQKILLNGVSEAVGLANDKLMERVSEESEQTRKEVGDALAQLPDLLSVGGGGPKPNLEAMLFAARKAPDEVPAYYDEWLAEHYHPVALTVGFTVEELEEAARFLGVVSEYEGALVICADYVLSVEEPAAE